MTETIFAPAVVEPVAHDPIRDALVESRQRWRHLVSLAADFAFETDARGRFVLVIPDPALGWPAASLVGQPSEFLVGENGAEAVSNPFRPTTAVHRQRTWIRCPDGTLSLMSISAEPLLDASGAIIGARGAGIDLTDSDALTSQIAGRLRRGEVLDHILSRVSQESSTDGMMDAGLWALIHALGAQGAAVISAETDGVRMEVQHECGPGAEVILEDASRVISRFKPEAEQTISADGRFILAIGCRTRFGVHAGLAIWRDAHSRPWDQEDILLIGSAIGIIRMILENEAIQREMLRHARTDPLTGVLNRRAFLEEMRRNTSHLDREGKTGTLMFVDLDSFKAVNDRLGHALGDKVLMHLTEMLRRMVRPSDLIARLGGDEFAVWLSGADHMTAAERAEALCVDAPKELQALLPERFEDLGVSIGIATRPAGSTETIDQLTRRADLAMYEVKRSGRRHWRVAILNDVR